MTKLIIQIPCLNEERTLGETIADLPTELPGIDEIELLVIDDGSTDRTVEVARENGVHHVVSHRRNIGLAKAFMTGIDASLRAGADIIVNTDADNQYVGQDIAKLVSPIVDGDADLVVGTRPISSIKTFSPLKRLLQRIGTHAVRVLSGADVSDATSGFRALDREAALRLEVHGSYTYTLETLIQAGAEGMKVTSVPIRVNDPTRPSRLVRSSFNYVKRSIPTLLRCYARYRPLRFFSQLACVPLLGATTLAIRWLVLRFTEPAESHVPSLVFASALLFLAAQMLTIGMVADIQAATRRNVSSLVVEARRRQLST